MNKKLKIKQKKKKKKKGKYMDLLCGENTAEDF